MFDEVSLRLIINGKVVIRKSFKNVINMKIKLNHFEFKYKFVACKFRCIIFKDISNRLFLKIETIKKILSIWFG